jgi:splicing factor 3A subunit 3
VLYFRGGCPLNFYLVAEKLKQEGRHEIFEQETMEELEDDEGNVYNRKTYEDLKKQGLI